MAVFAVQGTSPRALSTISATRPWLVHSRWLFGTGSNLTLATTKVTSPLPREGPGGCPSDAAIRAGRDFDR